MIEVILKLQMTEVVDENGGEENTMEVMSQLFRQSTASKTTVSLTLSLYLDLNNSPTGWL